MKGFRSSTGLIVRARQDLNVLHVDIDSYTRGIKAQTTRVSLKYIVKILLRTPQTAADVVV